MADYQQSEINGTKWRRCFQLLVHNGRNQVPSIYFCEEDVMTAGDQTIRIFETACSTSYDATAEVPIYDPETLEPTGQTFTHADLYAMLFSAYMDTALKRDAAEQPTPEE